MKRILISEEEKNEIKSQHDDIDTKLMNFLLRRIQINEKQINSMWKDDEPFNVTEYTFLELPGYGFNSFSSKKDMEKRIIDMLYENDRIGEEVYEFKNELDRNRQKIIKTIRSFLNFILPKK
jgi:hypothetical protein